MQNQLEATKARAHDLVRLKTSYFTVIILQLLFYSYYFTIIIERIVPSTTFYDRFKIL